MANEGRSLVPVWTLATTDSVRNLPPWPHEMTPERLSELRTALTAFADSPVVTLEAHPMPSKLDRSLGIPLDAISPLAQNLAQLVAKTAKSAPAVAHIESTGEIFYRMVVPAKLAAKVGKGLVRPMASKAVQNGVYSGLRDARGLIGNATFVPVATEAAAAGAAGGAAGTAAAGAATAGALTVAAPLVLLAVAVGVSAYADHKRQQAIEHITELLETLRIDRLDAERSELDGCRDAIDKATAILLDQGKIGASLGLDSAVYAISKATELARHRLQAWRTALDTLPNEAVEMSQLMDSFPGIDGVGGEFRAHLDLAELAIALKRRVMILQAVEHSQSDLQNPFENFLRNLRADQQRIDQLESDITSVLLDLSNVHLRAPARFLDKLMTRSEVNDLMRSSYRLRELGDRVEQRGPATDVVIEIAKQADGSILVLPAVAAQG